MKSALITGASQGIGSEIATQLARAGFYVYINYYRSKDAATELAKRLNKDGYRAEAIYADVSKAADIKNMKDHISTRCRSLDVLINNAGTALWKLITDCTEEDWDHLINTNLKSVFLVTNAFLPMMIQEKKGSIINISSIWGVCGASCEVIYSTSKAGIIGFTKALAKEIGPSSVRVNCIAPGVIETKMNGFLNEEESCHLKQEIPLSHFGTSNDIAHMAMFLASDQSAYITGQVIQVDGGFAI